MSDLETRVKALLHNGKNREAAELLIEGGELQRAMEAYAAVWDYERAAEVALVANDRPAALDYLLRAGDRRGAAEVRAKLATAPAEEAERAVELLLERGEKAHAATLLEGRGELVRAAELVKTLGEMRRAAALLERSGDYRGAGRLYERLVKDDPNDAAAALSLGNILRRFGKNELAARMLQVAAKDRKTRKAALRGLVCALHGLGMQDAASSALEELLDEDGSAPRTVEGLVASEEDGGEGGTGDEGQEWVGGRYQVIRVLGGGAAGRVYLARDALYEREVALKVLAAGAGGSAGRDAFTRFAREAQIAAKLDHPNIVRVMDFDRTAGVLVMEHIGGGTLGDRIAEGRVPLATVQDVAIGVLEALETAHLRGVVHRDIKPQNILFARGGGVKLVDFGVAHLQDLGLTQTGAFIGTLTYMAPEQITGDKASGGTDLYGLGATLFHALCGRPPFVGADLVRQHLAEHPPLPSELRPALGTRFDDLFQKLLAKVPRDRFAGAAEVRTALAAIDFTEPEDEEDAAPAAPAPKPIQADEGEVFIAVEAAQEVPGGAGRKARHRRLDVGVSLLKLSDPARLARLAELGQAVSPFIQCVLDVDEAANEVVLEEPEGELLSTRVATSEEAGGRHLEPAEALDIAEQLAAALHALHAAGLTHGDLGADRVVVSEHRATLLLPARDATGQSPEGDVRALEKLFAASLATFGGFSQALTVGPLAEALGTRRSAELRKGLPASPDLPALRQALANIRDALRDRNRAREHVHALAAAARAAGADPRSGKLAAFLEQRQRELDT